MLSVENLASRVEMKKGTLHKTKGGNENHPPKGSRIKVEPIRSLKSIKTIKQLLNNHPKNFCLFVLGINTALRASDLVKIQAGHVRHLSVGDTLELKETKTKKPRQITLNKSAVAAIQNLLGSGRFLDTDTLFKGQRGPMIVPTVHRLVKTWCRMINLKGNYGSHTLRKTFGYHQRVTYGRDLATLVEVFGHSTQKQTLEYLCVQAAEIKDVYMS